MTRGNELLENLIMRLREHADVRAVWLAGSRGRGTDDEYSDIDIWVALDNVAIPDVVADPLAWIHTLVPTIMHSVVPGIAPAGGAFVGSWVPVDHAFVQVDWYITPFDGATRAEDTRMVVDDVPVAASSREPRLPVDEVNTRVWDNLMLAMLMVNNMVKYARRGLTWRATDHARHADGCLANAAWFLDNGSEPGYEARRRTFLPEPVRHDAPGVRRVAQVLLDTAEDLAARADLREQVVSPVASMRRVISEWENAPFVPADEYYRGLARRRVGAGVLITDAEGRVLLLETTYKQAWEIPGGTCEAGENPRETVVREVHEELALNLDIGPLLIFDHRSEPDPKGDAIMLVYDGGVMNDPTRIAIDQKEIAAWRFVMPDDLERFTTARMAMRLRAALQARHQNRTIEIENGEVVQQ